MRFSTLALALLLLPGAGVGQDRGRVDLLLVLAIDSSGSTRDGDFFVQIRGHAAAFRSPEVARAIASGPERRIAAAVIVWSDDAQQWRCIDWTPIASAGDAARFADRIERCPFIGGGTSIGGAIRNATTIIGWAPYRAGRRAIDLSANSRSARTVEPARTLAVRAGITVNALVLQNESEDLLPYFSRFVVGGPGAFVVEATPDSYLRALIRKLSIEISMIDTNGPKD